MDNFLVWFLAVPLSAIGRRWPGVAYTIMYLLCGQDFIDILAKEIKARRAARES